MSTIRDILLIDYHNRDRAVCAAMLTGYGYHVQEARTPEEAQVALQSGYAPHTIILDVKTADTSVEALLSLTQAATRIIIIGKAENASTVRQGYAFVSKPVQPAELLNYIV